MIGLLVGSGFGHHCIFQIEVEFFEYITADFDVIFLEVRFLSVIFYGFKYTTCRSHMAYTVDQNHLSKSFVFLKLIKYDLFGQFDLAQCDLIFFDIICCDMFSGVDIDLVFDAADKSRNSLGSQFYQIFFSKSQLCCHPSRAELR